MGIRDAKEEELDQCQLSPNGIGSGAGTDAGWNRPVVTATRLRDGGLRQHQE